MRADLLSQISTEYFHPAVIERQTDRERDELNGLVESIVESVSSFQKDWQWKKHSTYKASSSKYDKEGNKLERCRYHTSGSRSCHEQYKYDNAGKLVEAIEDDFDTLYCKRNYLYDTTGKLISSIEYDAAGKVTFNSVYRYDAESRIDECIHYRQNGLIWNRIKFFYDEELNKLESTKYLEWGATKHQDVYWFNRQKRLTQKTRYDSEMKEQWKEYFSYDVSGNLVERNYCNATGIEKRIYFYDDDGRVVGEEDYAGDGSLCQTTRLSYKWDQYGNWWKRKIIIHFTKEDEWYYLISYRKIIYY